MSPEIQWYIARDGKQYGPLSDPEMGLFVKGGHLKSEDLVWRPGFNDWMPAYVAFPAPPAPAPQHHAAEPAARTGPQASAANPAASSRGGRATASQPAKARDAATGRSMVAVEQGFPDDEASDDTRRPSRLGRTVKTLVVLGIIAGLGWLSFQNRDSIKGFISNMVAGGKGGSVAIDPSVPAFIVQSSGAAEAIDASLQRTALWSVVKREFPDWYGERLKETAKLKSDRSTDAAITKHLLEAIVALRRKHANDALAASSPRLISIADAFLANLKKISTHSTTTCYSFISQGESSPAIIEMVQKNGGDSVLQAQVTAIFEAIAEGRKSPIKYAAPAKSDYDALAEQLTKLGWSQADLQLFADPRALARASHDRVCKMVQDWFSAHISIRDRAAQERLLIETLRPVVAG